MSQRDTPRSTSLPDVDSLTELLVWRSERHGDERACTFLAADGSPAAALSYAQLDGRARTIAARLQDVSRQGDRVILLYPPGLDYLAAFFGCLYAGVVAVPAYPPDPMAFNRSVARLGSMVEDAGAAIVMSDAVVHEARQEIFRRVPRLASLHWLGPDGRRETWRPRRAHSEDVAFLQYTSGSTGTPKGVMVSHANLLLNFRCMNAKVGDRHECMVSWLPPYHDMGLIGGMLYPIAGGYPTVLMSPATFLKQPYRWLDAIARYRGTISPAPNFAYDLCVRKVTEAERARLDLGSWAVAINGAEPVRMETIRRFTERFARSGFRPEAFTPCFGLAEGTLIVTGKPRGSLPRSFLLDRGAYGRGRAVTAPPDAADAVELASSGTPIEGHRIVIVDPATSRPCAAGEIGEVWVSGPCVAKGYWGRPGDSLHTFAAELAPPAEEGRFLRTGDLGFMAGPELVVSGRLKDVVVLNGVKYHSADVEAGLTGCHPTLRPGCAVVFSLESDERELVAVVHEVVEAPENPREVFLAIRRRVQEVAALTVDAIFLVPPRTIPKTSSGKMQRQACRQALLSGALQPTAEMWSAGTRRRRRLSRQQDAPQSGADGGA